MEQAKKRYVIVHGILGMGIPAALLWSFLTVCERPGACLDFQSPEWTRFLPSFFAAIPIFTIGGYLHGLWTYKHFQKAVAASDQPAGNMLAVKALTVVIAALLAVWTAFFMTTPFSMPKFLSNCFIVFSILVFVGIFAVLYIFKPEKAK
jgi:hypothetical protein